MVSDCILISILAVMVEPMKMYHAPAPQARDLNPEDWLSLLHLMCDFKNSNL